MAVLFWFFVAGSFSYSFGIAGFSIAEELTRNWGGSVSARLALSAGLICAAVGFGAILLVSPLSISWGA